MLKYSYKPERCRCNNVDEIKEYLNRQLLLQNDELRRVLDSACREIEELKEVLKK